MMGFDEEQETQQHPWQVFSAFGNDHSEIKVKRSHNKHKNFNRKEQNWRTVSQSGWRGT